MPLDVGESKLTTNLNGDKYTYSFLRTSSFPSPFPPEDEEKEEVGSLCFVETLRDPLQRAMENQYNDQQDEELEEATKGLEPQDGSVEEEKFEDIGDTRPEEPQVLEVDLKPDEDMATMLMSMCGAWIGEDRVQQGFPNQEGGPRLIRFESPMWRPKAIQVRA
jgi:hypothetical protein